MCQKHKTQHVSEKCHFSTASYLVHVEEVLLGEESLPLLVQVVEAPEEALDLGGVEARRRLQGLHLLCQGFQSQCEQ